MVFPATQAAAAAATASSYTIGPAANKAGSSIDLCSASTWVRMPPAALELPLRRLSDEQVGLARNSCNSSSEAERSVSHECSMCR
jgi:hypothetical protein